MGNWLPKAKPAWFALTGTYDFLSTFVALISGGKDSCFNCVKCINYGHELVCLANIYPENEEKVEVELVYEFDSSPKKINIICKSIIVFMTLHR